MSKIKPIKIRYGTEEDYKKRENWFVGTFHRVSKQIDLTNKAAEKKQVPLHEPVTETTYAVATIDMYDYGETSERGVVVGKTNALKLAENLVLNSIDRKKRGCLRRQWFDFGEDVILTPISGTEVIEFSGEVFIAKVCSCETCKQVLTKMENATQPG